MENLENTKMPSRAANRVILVVTIFGITIVAIGFVCFVLIMLNVNETRVTTRRITSFHHNKMESKIDMLLEKMDDLKRELEEMKRKE